jgi:tetratricopeptide (TPR) repeat protein
VALLALPVHGDQRHEHEVPDELGVVDFPISCSEQAQEEFNRALALLHHMTYPQARRVFESVAELDPDCAMAHWGIAMTLFQPSWPTRPSPDDLQRGWQAAQTAVEIGSPSKLEELFVATAVAFFLEPAGDDYWLRVRRWEEAMAAVHAAFPHNHDAAALYALAHLAVAPADQASNSNSALAADLLLEVYRENPEHPGAMHYLIHANDAPGRESNLLEVVRKYETVAPNNPHALHMPTHIYTRLGDWDGVVRGNLRAAEAALLHPAGADGELVSDEFPHAIEYLVYAYLQQGADDKAEAELRRLWETPKMQPSFKTAFHLASTEARYALERRAWGEASAVVPRNPSGLDWDRFRWPEAISWFARGLGAARQGDAEEARRAATHLGELEVSAREAGESLFARNIRILELELDAWIAGGAGELESAVDLMRQAAEIEASTPKHAVTPGPTLPALEQLGDLLLEEQRSRESLAAYEAALELYPGRLNSLVGAARAARAHEDLTGAAAHYRAVLEGTADGARPSVVQEARDYLSASTPQDRP